MLPVHQGVPNNRTLPETKNPGNNSSKSYNPSLDVAESGPGQSQDAEPVQQLEWQEICC